MARHSPSSFGTAEFVRGARRTANAVAARISTVLLALSLLSTLWLFTASPAAGQPDPPMAPADWVAALDDRTFVDPTLEPFVDDADRWLGLLLDRRSASPHPEQRARLHLELGHRWRQENRPEPALAHYRQAARLDPELGEAHLATATLAGREGRYRESARSFAWLLELDPSDPRAPAGRALALRHLGYYRLARGTLETAVERWPDDPSLADALARLLAASPDPRVRDGRRAVALAERALRDGRQARYAETLAMAFAEAGRPDDAAALVRTLIERAGSSSPDFVGQLRRQLDLYQDGRPFRFETPRP